MTSGPLDPPQLANPRAERVRAVRGLSARSARSRRGRFVAEGPQAVGEAVAAHAAAVAEGLPGVILDLYVGPEAQTRHAELLARAAAVAERPRPATAEVLDAMAGTVHPQGLLAVCARRLHTLDEVVATRPRLVAVLAQVRDPGNAGTVIRTADAAGAEAVVLAGASVDPYNAKCVRATAGSLFHLPVVAGVGLVEAVSRLRGAGLTILAADAAGERDLDELIDDAEAGRAGGLAGPVAWVFGNEAWGLPGPDRGLADATVRVRMDGPAESLNLSSAAAICLYASARAQRRAGETRRPAGDGI